MWWRCLLCISSKPEDKLFVPSMMLISTWMSFMSCNWSSLSGKVLPQILSNCLTPALSVRLSPPIFLNEWGIITILTICWIWKFTLFQHLPKPSPAGIWAESGVKEKCIILENGQFLKQRISESWGLFGAQFPWNMSDIYCCVNKDTKSLNYLNF